MVISSALIIIAVCIEQQKWDWLGYYAGLTVIWMFIGWLWTHRKLLKHDFGVIFNCETPFKCKWGGSFIVMALIVIIIMALIFWGVCAVGAWLIKML